MNYEVYSGSPPTPVKYSSGYWVPIAAPRPLGTCEVLVQENNRRPRPPQRDELYWDSDGRVVIHVSTLSQARERAIPGISGTALARDIRRQIWTDLTL